MLGFEDTGGFKHSQDSYFCSCTKVSVSEFLLGNTTIYHIFCSNLYCQNILGLESLPEDMPG